MPRTLKNIRIFIVPVIMACWLFLTGSPASSTEVQSTQDKLMALYLYNFILFVDWPAGKFSADNQIKVAIIDDPEFYEALKPMEGGVIRGKKLVVTHVSKIDDRTDCCHIAFMGASDPRALEKLFKKFHGKSTLTMSDKEGFLERGGMVRFLKPGEKNGGAKKQKRFAINLTAVEEAGLKVRSRMLRISEIIYTPKPLTP